MSQMLNIDSGRKEFLLANNHRSISLRIDLRSLAVCLGISGLSLLLALYSLATGDFSLSLNEVFQAVIGQGSNASSLVVVQWRLPRVLMALLLGAVMGVSGAIFQSMTRNPLGSPDIIGFNTGAYSGALVVILMFQGGYYAVASGALLGGLLTAAVVYLLAYKHGAQGFRLVIVGIAVSAILASLNTWLILRSDLEDAMSAAVWGAGSLNAIGWDQAVPAVVLSIVILAFALSLSGRMRLLEMGDDAASGLGVRTESSKLWLLVVGVALTAVATAAAGPIAFIALAAPQVARRLTNTAGVRMLPAAVIGAFLLLLSDFIAQRAFVDTSLPVGVVTVSVGGIYLLWLLLREAKRQ